MSWLSHFRIDLRVAFGSKLRRAEQERPGIAPADRVRAGRERGAVAVAQGLREVAALLAEHEDMDAVLTSLGVDPREVEVALMDWVVLTAEEFACRDGDDDELSDQDRIGQYRACLNGLLVGLLLHRQSIPAVPSAAGRR